MPLYAQLRDDLKAAMKAGDAFRRDVIRFLESALKNAAIEKRKPVYELTDQEVHEIVRRGIKQRRDSIEQYRSGGRPELAEKEEAEVAVLEGYLPAALPDAELETLVRAALVAGGFTSKADFGKAMGAAMKEVAGRAEGDRVKAMVEKLLA